MQPQHEPSIFISLLPLIFMSLFVSVGSFFLAKEKGRNVVKWTILGAIPLVNFACVWFFVGAANLHTERKLDQILAELQKNSSRTSS
jgi:O-antigen/teichoic acid export membrane protein